MKEIIKKNNKVALIGNMNNNNFALMRILRDNNINAHLFLYSNETFLPQSDTTNFLKWKRFIHDLEISNGKPDILFFNKTKLKDKLKEFNFIIGNGISPYILKKINRRVNILMPYAEGIEHINENSDPLFPVLPYILKKGLSGYLKNIWFKLCRFLQAKSVDNCDNITTFNLHDFSLDSFRKFGIKPEFIPLFTVYKKNTV